MSNDKIHSYYTKLAEKITAPQDTRNKAPDFSEYDIAFMQQFAGAEMSLLDLGAGSGLLLNAIAQQFGDIVAVELYEEFSKFIAPRPNLHVINSDIRSFDTVQSFDVVIAFGVLNFFSVEEASAIYAKCFRFANPGGTLVIKHQMGREEDVVVDGFSEELQQHYFSNYRHTDHECRLIEAAGFTVVAVHDIYPDAFNRWENTRFNAIVAHKPG
ncbi:MAG: class I SAM-dependent methyltransferase [Pseudomonadota bacterium]